jgi:hypothetical protein
MSNQLATVCGGMNLQYDPQRTKAYTPRSILERIKVLKAEETAFLSTWLGIPVRPVVCGGEDICAQRRSHLL